MPSRAFAPGFRFSLLDLLVMVTGIAAALLASVWSGGIAWVIGFVLAHFFLFCNVFRLSRPVELTWAGVFVLLAAGTIVLDTPGWPLTTVVSLLVTMGCIAWEMRRPSYHGIGWRRINPALPVWWENHLAHSTAVSSELH